MATAFYCPACNPGRAASGFQLADLHDANRFPHCGCRGCMEPVRPSDVPAYWYALGRWYGDGEAMIEAINLPEECCYQEMPRNLPSPGHPYRAEWERGRVDGYRGASWLKNGPTHPDDWIPYDRPKPGR